MSRRRQIGGIDPSRHDEFRDLPPLADGCIGIQWIGDLLTQIDLKEVLPTSPAAEVVGAVEEVGSWDPGKRVRLAPRGHAAADRHVLGLAAVEKVDSPTLLDDRDAVLQSQEVVYGSRLVPGGRETLKEIGKYALSLDRRVDLADTAGQELSGRNGS